MRGCAAIRRRILLAVDGRLPLEERFQLDEHVARCEECARYQDLQQAIDEGLSTRPVPEVREQDLAGALGRIHAGIAGAPAPVAAAPRRRWRVPVALAAAGLLVVSVVSFWPEGPGSPAEDLVQVSGTDVARPAAEPGPGAAPGHRPVEPDPKTPLECLSSYSLTKADELSRVSGLLDGATKLVSYDYLGASRVVGTTYNEPGIFSAVGTGSGSYPDLDRFNRIISNRWTSDLTTDIDFNDIDIEYDRNSNITLIEDNVHSGFDVSYTMDDVDRLTDAEEGTWNGSSITNRSRHQTWTLDHTGNWDHAQLDLDGDNNWNETDEYDDDRTHNEVNELTGRDTDDNGTDDHTLAYDEVGNLTDDNVEYKHEYDPFGRMRKVRNQSDTLIAEYGYNGLGFMIDLHEDTDDDGDVDLADAEYHQVFDERWRKLATFRESDSDPKEELVNQLAGANGSGGGSYINGVVLRDKDANTAWAASSDGTLEERIYYCQNWRGDVSLLVNSSREMVEWVKYSAYGLPFGLPGADRDSDGDCDSTDIQLYNQGGGGYDARGDADLDGDVDGIDKTLAQSGHQGVQLGLMSLSAVGSRVGYIGSHEIARARWHCRARNYTSILGRWESRDPLSYVDGENLYQYSGNSPIAFLDPLGMTAIPASSSGHPALGGTLLISDAVPHPCFQLLQAHRRAGRRAGCCDDPPPAPGEFCARGQTICLGPKVVSCNFCPPDGSLPGDVTSACITVHEGVHEAGADCSHCQGNQWCAPRVAPGHGEGPAYLRQLDCLGNSAPGWCGTTDEGTMSEEVASVCDRGEQHSPSVADHPMCSGSPCSQPTRMAVGGRSQAISGYGKK